MGLTQYSIKVTVICENSSVINRLFDHINKAVIKSLG